MTDHFHLLLEAKKASEDEGGSAAFVGKIHARFTYRMHDLSEFTKGLLIRFTRWFNHVHARKGTLWEDRFKSVIVVNGVPAQSVAAYNDPNPVRAGMVKDPADYRWSSNGEAVGGGSKGNGTFLKDLGMAKMPHSRIRYFTDGARAFSGSGQGAKGVFWSIRDLGVGV